MTQKKARASKRYLRAGLALLGTLGLILALGTLGLRLYLDDERLTALVTKTANGHFAGTFEIDSVRWRLPLRFEADAVRVLSPHGIPVAKLGEVRATVRLVPLATGRIAVRDVVLKDLRVDLHMPPGGAQLAIAAALQAVPPSPPKPAAESSIPLRIDLQNVDIVRADIDSSQADTAARVRLSSLMINEGSVWLAGDSVGTTLNLSGSAHLSQSEQELEIPKFVLQLDDARLRFATDHPSGSVQRASLDMPGIALEASGDIRTPGSPPVAIDGQCTLKVDTENAVLRAQIPDPLRYNLRGALALKGVLSAKSASTQDFVIDLEESRFEVYAVPIKGLHVAGSLAGMNLQLQESTLRFADGHVAIQGSVALMPAAKVLAGNHALKVTAKTLPVRAVAGQFVETPALLPENVSFAARSTGRSLWPMTSQVDVEVIPDGLPGSTWPGLPSTMELRGRFLTHPDLLEILKLELAVEDTPRFAIQGSLPMESQSVRQLIDELHAPHPKGPLQRVPVAPARKHLLEEDAAND